MNLRRSSSLLSSAAAVGAVIGFVAGPAAATIVATTGLTVIAPPPLVTADFLITFGLPSQVAFDERQGVTLASALNTDTGTIAAGTVVDSQYVALNSVQGGIVNTSAQFDGQVLGVIYLTESYFAASDFLGAPGTTYADACGNCGFEPGDGDTATPVGNSVFFHNNYSEPGDFARVITAAASGVPEPTAWGLLVAGFAALGGLLRRRRALLTAA